MHKIIPKDAVLVPDNAKRVFKGIVYDVYHWPQKRFDGSEATFEMLKRWDTLVTIGVVDSKVLVIEETQPHNNTKMSFPGGRLDPEDTSILEACQREMLEETGYEFNSWRLVDVQQPFAKVEWFIHIYLATDVTKQSAPQHDPGEKITVTHESFESLKKLVETKVGYLGEARDMFDDLNSLEDLLQLPTFKGQEVDR